MNEWWSLAQSNQIGAWAGSGLGLLGGLAGTLCGVLTPKGRGKALVYGLFGLLILVGVVGLAAAGVAIALGQPRHVLFPLLLIGGTVLLTSVPVTIMLPRFYAIAESRRLEAQELRRSL